ncbi:hypothetical protein L1280_002156 [Deinococcus sp. HSC-46F16]|nr:DUF6624 domain-containing protein [Deinococcus sp. HSC-46F16]MCP2015004.1 hypothetical protein [Deinococcus sp. HSC-46F16]
MAREDWPGRSRVGEDGATAVWLLAPHSPDLAFQKEVLALWRSQPPGEVDPAHAASLYDRICIREGRPQRYGT